MSEFEFDPRPFGDYATDVKAELEGMWFQFGRVRLLCRRAGGANAEYTRALQHAYQETVEKGENFQSKIPDLLKDLYARLIVVNWQGVEDVKGWAIDFTPEACRAMFDKFPEVWAELQDKTAQRENFLLAYTDEAKDTLGKS